MINIKYLREKKDTNRQTDTHTKSTKINFSHYKVVNPLELKFLWGVKKLSTLNENWPK